MGSQFSSGLFEISFDRRAFENQTRTRPDGDSDLPKSLMTFVTHSTFGEEDAICTQFYRSNLHLRSRVLAPESHLEALINNLKTKPPGPTLVYVSLQKTAVAIAGECVAAGLNARPYHAGLHAEVRNENQAWFMEEENAIVVATIAFGMGIDKSDIRYVYHFQSPQVAGKLRSGDRQSRAGWR